MRNKNKRLLAVSIVLALYIGLWHMPSYAASGSQGLPAIHPRTTSTPAFSVADVVQYLRTHALPRFAAVGAPATVTGVQFMTSREVNTLPDGQETGLPDSALVCYVTLHGTFVIPGVRVPNSLTVRTFHGAKVIFDARTGNLLLSGSLPKDSADPTVQPLPKMRVRVPLTTGGLAAIRPRTEVVPSFSVADVAQYLAAHPFYGGLTLGNARPIVMRVVFVNGRSMRTFVGRQAVVRSGDRLLCYVELRGPFSLRTTSNGISTIRTGIEIFDARTGNLLAWGGL